MSSEVAIAQAQLSPEERGVVVELFSRGASVLVELGWTITQVSDFLNRPEVRTQLDLLKHEFDNQEAIQSRVQFSTKRGLARLAPTAVSTLNRAMAGPTYIRDPEGRIMQDRHGNPLTRDAGITPTQLRAAEKVMECLGIESKVRIDIRADSNLDVLMKPAEIASARIDVEDTGGLDPKEQALARERVRNLIEKLGPRAADLAKAIQQKMQKPRAVRQAAREIKAAKVVE